MIDHEEINWRNEKEAVDKEQRIFLIWCFIAGMISSAPIWFGIIALIAERY